MTIYWTNDWRVKFTIFNYIGNILSGALGKFNWEDKSPPISWILSQDNSKVPLHNQQDMTRYSSCNIIFLQEDKQSNRSDWKNLWVLINYVHVYDISLYTITPSFPIHSIPHNPLQAPLSPSLPLVVLHHLKVRTGLQKQKLLNETIILLVFALKWCKMLQWFWENLYSNHIPLYHFLNWLW